MLVVLKRIDDGVGSVFAAFMPTPRLVLTPTLIHIQRTTPHRQRADFNPLHSSAAPAHGATNKKKTASQHRHPPPPQPEGFLPCPKARGLFLPPTAALHRRRREAAGWECLGLGGEGLRGAGHGSTRGHEVRGSGGGVEVE